MEQLDHHIFDVISKLWKNKKQPNGNSIYNHILKSIEWLTAIQLEGRGINIKITVVCLKLRKETKKKSIIYSYWLLCFCLY